MLEETSLYLEFKSNAIQSKSTFDFFVSNLLPNLIEAIGPLKKVETIGSSGSYSVILKVDSYSNAKKCIELLNGVAFNDLGVICLSLYSPMQNNQNKEKKQQSDQNLKRADFEKNELINENSVISKNISSGKQTPNQINQPESSKPVNADKNDKLPIGKKDHWEKGINLLKIVKFEDIKNEATVTPSHKRTDLSPVLTTQQSSFFNSKKNSDNQAYFILISDPNGIFETMHQILTFFSIFGVIQKATIIKSQKQVLVEFSSQLSCNSCFDFFDQNAFLLKLNLTMTIQTLNQLYALMFDTHDQTALKYALKHKVNHALLNSSQKLPNVSKTLVFNIMADSRWNLIDLQTFLFKEVSFWARPKIFSQISNENKPIYAFVAEFMNCSESILVFIKLNRKEYNGFLVNTYFQMNN